MGPKLLGGGGALLAAAFILALPSIFEGEPADEVEPIRFGPPPVTGLADAEQVTAPSPRPSMPSLAGPASHTQPASPVVVSGGSDGGTAAAGAERDTFSERPGGNRPKDREKDDGGKRDDGGERNVVEDEVEGTEAEDENHAEEDEGTGEETAGNGSEDGEIAGAGADEDEDPDEDEDEGDD